MHHRNPNYLLAARSSTTCDHVKGALERIEHIEGIEHMMKCFGLWFMGR